MAGGRIRDAKPRWRRGTAPAIIGTLLLAGAAAADPGDAPEDPGDTILVTAQGRSEDRRDVPIAIQSFTGVELDRLNVREVRALSAYVPGLLVETQYPTTPTIVIRGISTDTADVTAEPRISVYQDGVYVSRPQQALFEFFDLERVEVIKGPQSTLFGRSALTGAISVIQNKADPRGIAASARIGAGNYGQRVGEAMLNLPLSPHVALRVAGIVRDRDGYIRNLAGGPKLNGNDARALRGSLHAATANGGTIDLIGNYQRDRFTGISYKSAVFAPADPATGAALASTDPFGPAFLRAAPGFPTDRLGGSRALGGATLLAEQPLAEGLTLSAIAAWTRFRATFTGDVDGTGLDIATTREVTRNRQYSGELRLRYDPGGPLSASAGINVAEERGSQDILLQVDEREILALQTGLLDRRVAATLPQGVYTAVPTVAAQLQGIAAAAGAALTPPFAAAIAANLLADHRESVLRTSRNRFYEAFGSVLYEPDDRLSLEAGLRYTQAEKRSGIATAIEQRSVLAGFLGALAQPAAVRDALLPALAVPGAAVIPPSAAYPLPVFGLLYQATAAGEERRALKRGGAAWRLSARYAATPALNVYANYARGRRPDVLSPQPPLTPGGAARFTDLRDETVDSIEGGAKYRAGGLELDGALFAYRYRRFQTEVIQGTTLVSIDAGRAKAWGGEAAARYAVTPGLRLFATYGYTRARFGSGVYRGNRFRLSPDHTASAGGTLDVALAGGTVSVTPTVDWRSRLYFDNSNGDLAVLAGGFLTPLPFQASQGPYARANLNVGYGPDDGRWQVRGQVSNLFDRKYLRDLGVGSLSFGLPAYVAAPPRLFELSLTIRTGR